MDNIANLHERINLRGVLENFLDIAIDRFHYSLQKNKVGFEKRGRHGGVRAGELWNSFKKALFYTGGNIDKAQITFAAYGRMVDMGVGKGVNYNQQAYSQSSDGKRSRDRTGRRKKPWYSKTKTHELIRLREILAKEYQINLLVEVESALNQSITVNYIL